MKKLKYCAFFFFVLFGTTLIAQKSALPKKVLATFEKKFPGVDDVESEVKTKGDYKIKFKFNGKKTEIEIADDGTWEKTTTKLSFEDLPQEVKTSVNAQKKKAEISGVKSVVTNKSEIIYKIELKEGGKKTKLQINKKGKIIKTGIGKKE